MFLNKSLYRHWLCVCFTSYPPLLCIVKLSIILKGWDRVETHHHYDKFGLIWRSSRSENLIYKLSIELKHTTTDKGMWSCQTPLELKHHFTVLFVKAWPKLGVLFQFTSTIVCCYLISAQITYFPPDCKYCDRTWPGQTCPDTWSQLRAAPVKRDVTNQTFDRHKDLSIFHFDQIVFKYAW